MWFLANKQWLLQTECSCLPRSHTLKPPRSVRVLGGGAFGRGRGQGGALVNGVSALARGQM